MSNFYYFWYQVVDWEKLLFENYMLKRGTLNNGGWGERRIRKGN